MGTVVGGAERSGGAASWPAKVGLPHRLSGRCTPFVRYALDSVIIGLPCRRRRASVAARRACPSVRSRVLFRECQPRPKARYVGREMGSMGRQQAASVDLGRCSPPPPSHISIIVVIMYLSLTPSKLKKKHPLPVCHAIIGWRRRSSSQSVSDQHASTPATLSTAPWRPPTPPRNITCPQPRPPPPLGTLGSSHRPRMALGAPNVPVTKGHMLSALGGCACMHAGTKWMPRRTPAMDEVGRVRGTAAPRDGWRQSGARNGKRHNQHQLPPLLHCTAPHYRRPLGRSWPCTTPGRLQYCSAVARRTRWCAGVIGHESMAGATSDLTEMNRAIAVGRDRHVSVKHTHCCRPQVSVESELVGQLVSMSMEEKRRRYVHTYHMPALVASSAMSNASSQPPFHPFPPRPHASARSPASNGAQHTGAPERESQPVSLM